MGLRYRDVVALIDKAENLYVDFLTRVAEGDKEVEAVDKLAKAFEKRLTGFDADMKKEVKKLRYDIGRLKQQRKRKK